MTSYLLGIITGLAIATLTFAILAFFRAGIEKRVKIIETYLGEKGPKPKGAIFIPESDRALSQKEIIERNRAQGKDTKFEDLM